jgi:predicted transcriptional regulator
MVGRRKGSSSMTPLELQIMQVLWQEGPSNVQHVQQCLAPQNELAYNTVQTMLNVLQRKRRVKRKLVGRAYVYGPSAAKETVLGQLVSDFVERIFAGSSEDLVMSLVKSKQVDAETLAELSRRVTEESEGETNE